MHMVMHDPEGSHYIIQGLKLDRGEGNFAAGLSLLHLSV